MFIKNKETCLSKRYKPAHKFKKWKAWHSSRRKKDIEKSERIMKNEKIQEKSNNYNKHLYSYFFAI